MPAFVAEKEPEVLISLLGDDLYTDFIDGLNALPAEWLIETPYTIGDSVVYGVSVFTALTDNVGITPTEGTDWTITDLNNRWLKLKKGAKYILNNKPYVWPGMVKMLRPFIFSEFLRAGFDTYSGIGMVVPTSENSSVVSPGDAIASAWMTYARIAGDNLNQRNTLYGFLKYEGDAGIYDDVLDPAEFTDFYGYLSFFFTCPGTQNVFDF